MYTVVAEGRNAEETPATGRTEELARQRAAAGAGGRCPGGRGGPPPSPAAMTQAAPLQRHRVAGRLRWRAGVDAEGGELPQEAE